MTSVGDQVAVQSFPSPLRIGTSKEKLFISISGLIGAGKTTLAAELGKLLGLNVFYEPVVDNLFLEDFYKDPTNNAFKLQIYLLHERFKQQQKITWENTGGIQDRSIYEDGIFSRVLCADGHMSEKDLNLYLDFFNTLSNLMRKPNVIVHLQVTPETSLKRIKERNRACEVGITLEYLTSLYEAYEKFILEIAKIIPVIIVPWDEIHSPEVVAIKIKQEMEFISTIHKLVF